MLRLLLGCAMLIVSGCGFAAAGAGTSGDVAWAFTINNTLPPMAVPPGYGDGGLIVIVTYQDGYSTSYVVAAGSSLSVPGNGATAVVYGGGMYTTVGPGAALFWSNGGWSSSPPMPYGSG